MSENILPSGAQLSGKHLCKTGVECELAIILGQDIPVREKLWARDEFADFIEAVAPAIEIVENRYGDFPRQQGVPFECSRPGR